MAFYGPQRPYNYSTQTVEEYIRVELREQLSQAYRHEIERLLWGNCHTPGCVGQDPDCGMRVSDEQLRNV